MSAAPVEFEQSIESCAATRAIRDALAILDAISGAGCFEALPKSQTDRRRHTTGITLLELLETRLRQAVENEAPSRNFGDTKIAGVHAHE